MKQTIYILSILIAAWGCKEKSTDNMVNQSQNNIEQGNQDMDKTMNNETNNEPEWIVLFDGSSMDQWRGYGMDNMPAEWTIEGDALAFTPGEEGGKNIISRETCLLYTSDAADD